MNNREAKEILALFRPGSADEQDVSFEQARELAKTDAELAAWFEQHCLTYVQLRRRFQTIPVPPGLMEQILSERKIERSLLQRYWGPALAAAALIALLLGIESGFWPLHFNSDPYAVYEKRMVKLALSDYYMEILEKNEDKIREHFREKNAPADYVLPSGLAAATAVGCAEPTWQTSPVSLICFKSGRPMPPGDQSDVWFFVIDRKAVANAPATAQPVFARVNKAMTASWSDTGHSYLLAAVGDEEFLRKYLQP